MLKIGVAVGTRPEAVKVCPLIIEFQKRGIVCEVIMSGQHVDLVQDVLKTFGIKEKINLSIENKDGDLSNYFSSLLLGYSKHFDQYNYDLFLVHGDTLTATAAALACYFKRIKLGHIESGLRTNNIFNPFPEEANRELIDLVSTFKFAPTELAYSNLKNKEFSVITGNTGIDAVRAMYDVYLRTNVDLKSFLQKEYGLTARNYLLVTLHRRESFGSYHRKILKTLGVLSKKVQIVYILHPNPQIKDLALAELRDNQQIKLLDPQTYSNFFYLMLGAQAIVTDSGGIQEEAFSLGIPLLVARDNTERPEILNSSANFIVGDNSESLLRHAEFLLGEENQIPRSFSTTELGDGEASSRIIDFIFENLT